MFTSICLSANGLFLKKNILPYCSFLILTAVFERLGNFGYQFVGLNVSELSWYPIRGPKSTFNIGVISIIYSYFTLSPLHNPPIWRVYYSLAAWRFKPISRTGLRFHSHLSGGLRLRNYRAVAGNHKFSSRFSGFMCLCGGYSNRIKRHRRLSGNFILLKASLFNKALPFRARPSQSGLPSVLKDRL